IRLYDANRDGDRCYLVMEYVEGRDLARLLKERGPLLVAEACAYVRQAALGLQHAHERGFVHSDIKPSNLLLTTGGVVKILDLGLARLREGAPDAGDGSDPLTPSGMMMGTPDFMAPEQAESVSTVDVRADLYSLGCALFQLLSGQVPFPGGSLPEKLLRHFSHKPPPLTQSRPDVPAGLAAVVERLPAERPAPRYPTPAGLADAVLPSGKGTGAAPRPRVRPPEKPGESQTPHFPETLQPGDNDGTEPLPRTEGDARAPRRRAPFALAAVLLLACA